jgi:hypothetical protein
VYVSENEDDMPAPVLRIVSPDGLLQQEAAVDAQRVAAEEKLQAQAQVNSALSAFIDNEFSTMMRHRDGASGWSDRLVNAMRVFNGQYDNTKLAEIRKFGGSDIYARLIATKCRGATSLLRDVYLNQEKPWGLKPTPDPTLPDDMLAAVQQLVEVEVQTMTRLGEPPTQDKVKDRIQGLLMAAKRAAIKRARLEAEVAFNKVDDLLVEGGFYEALAACLIDVPLFPFCCLKGPTVRVVPEVTWVQGQAQMVNKPKMFWNRISPFDVWWTPGVATIADAAVIERTRVTRQDLNQLIGLPGYNQAAIQEVLRWYGQSGYVEANASFAETPRAVMESREDPRMNQSGVMDMLEYHGYVQGTMLIDQGFTSAQVPDPLKDYFVDAFKIGRYVIKVQLSPSLKKRAPYYVTSFEKVPGTVVGNALPDILSDVQDATNAALRSLVNNMSIASGPQVVVNDDRIAENENGDELYPWKRWHVVTDPLGANNGQQPINFFQPESRAQELLGVYEKFTQIADELSAIPRYITGSERLGGAGRTASGLAMLMGNAAKILQTVAANIDGDIIEPGVNELYDMVMLTDRTGLLRGDESIEVLGVNVAMQRETQRQRQLEFLQITANPIDAQITGVRGRANVLRAVSEGIGLDGDDIVPPDEEIQAQQQNAPPGGPGGPPGPGGPGGPPGGPAPPGGAPGGQSGAPGGAPSGLQPPQTNVVGKTPQRPGGPATPPNPAQGPG